MNSESAVGIGATDRARTRWPLCRSREEVPVESSRQGREEEGGGGVLRADFHGCGVRSSLRWSRGCGLGAGERSPCDTVSCDYPFSHLMLGSMMGDWGSPFVFREPAFSCRYDSLFADRPPLPSRRARETYRHGPARDAKRGRGGMACGVLSGERVRVSARAARPCEHAARCGARSTHLSRLLSTPGRNQIDHKTRSRAREANGRVTE